MPDRTAGRGFWRREASGRFLTPFFNLRSVPENCARVWEGRFWLSMTLPFWGGPRTLPKRLVGKPLRAMGWEWKRKGMEPSREGTHEVLMVKLLNE